MSWICIVISVVAERDRERERERERESVRGEAQPLYNQGQPRLHDCEIEPISAQCVSKFILEKSF